MNTGFKLVNDPKKKKMTFQMLEAFSRDERLHTEIGLYFEENEMDDIFRDYFASASGRVNHHLRHSNTVLDLRTRRDDFIRDLETAKTMNCSYSIIHLAASKPRMNVFHQLDNIERSLPLFSELNDIARAYNHAFYLENIYHNIPFYRELFYQIAKKGLDRIHFCLDLGHAKACSQNTISEWYELLKEMESWNRKLHFHLHLNYGLSDDHLSLIEYSNPYGDWFSEGVLYDRLIREMIMDFPGSRKIFEVKPEYAVSNMNYVQRMLDEDRAIHRHGFLSKPFWSKVRTMRKVG